MEIQAVIDRFEGNKAVLLVGEDETQVVWSRHILPREVKEGDILRIDLHIDHEATAVAKKEAEDLLKQILERNHEG